MRGHPGHGEQRRQSWDEIGAVPGQTAGHQRLGFAGQASAATIGQTGGGNAFPAGELQLDESPNYAVPGTNGVIDRVFFNADGVPSGQKVDFLVSHHRA